MKNEKILITGAGSTVADALALSLASDNEVWGMARFRNAEKRAALDAAGVRTISLDVGSGDYEALPRDFTYLLHLAYFRGPKASDIPEAVRVNVEGTGLIFHHCRSAKAALYMSSSVIYSPHDDPWHAFTEEEPIGGAAPSYSATASLSKVAAEGVARASARMFDLPVIIARLNAPYGLGERLLPTNHMDQVMAGQPIAVHSEPEPYSPIHLDDMCDQLDALLDAASVPATVVNWTGDEAVPVQQWCEMAAEWGGRDVRYELREIANQKKGNLCDPSKRRAITGPCKVRFADGFRRAFDARYPDAVAGAGAAE